MSYKISCIQGEIIIQQDFYQPGNPGRKNTKKMLKSGEKLFKKR